MALLRNDRNVKHDSRSPARSFMATFRLLPWLRPARGSDANVEAYHSADSAGQNPLEIWLASLTFNLMWMLLICSALWHVVSIPPWAWPLVFLGSSAIAVLVIIGIMGLAEPVARWLRRTFQAIDPALVHSTAQQLVLMVASIGAALDSHWIRWAGRAWIAIVAVELLARVVEVAFRREVEPSAN